MGCGSAGLSLSSLNVWVSRKSDNTWFVGGPTGSEHRTMSARHVGDVQSVRLPQARTLQKAVKGRQPWGSNISLDLPAAAPSAPDAAVSMRVGTRWWLRRGCRGVVFFFFFFLEAAHCLVTAFVVTGAYYCRPNHAAEMHGVSRNGRGFCGRELFFS